MYPIDTPEVVILDRVHENPKAEARLQRLMKGINADAVHEVDEKGLDELFAARGWDQRSGSLR